MNHNFKWAILGVVGIYAIMALAQIFSTPPEIDSKWESCLKVVNDAIPDPNDDGRAELLKTCYEN